MPKYKDIIKENCYRSSGEINAHCNKETWWSKRNLIYVYDDILEYTNFLTEDSKISVRLYHYLNDIDTPSKCSRDGCSNNTKFDNRFEKYGKYCSRKCTSMATAKYGSDNRFSTQETKEKIKKANLAKYGHENVSHSTHFKEKMANYYGTLSDEKMNEIIEKRAATNVEKYGYTTPFMAESVKEKITATMIERYGVEKPLQNQDILAKQKRTNVDRYGAPNKKQRYYSQELLNNLGNVEWFEEQMKLKSVHGMSIEHNTSYTAMCTICRNHGIVLVGGSTFENEIHDYVSSKIDVSLTRHNKKLLNGLEIDMLSDELKVGIECNGIYWHSEMSGNKDMFYHLRKTNMMKEVGYTLMHIFEDDWHNKQDVCKSRLVGLFSDFSILDPIHCDVSLLDPADEETFLNFNSIHGCKNSDMCYCIRIDGEIVSVASFKKVGEYSWEIVGFADKLYNYYENSLSLMLDKFVISCHPDNIVFRIPKEFGSEHMKHTRMTHGYDELPTYRYVDTRKRLKVLGYGELPKLLETFDPSLTEWENMQNNGYDRIWDCGNSVWFYNTPK